MKRSMIGLLAETSLHPGTEQSAGVIDMPVAREVITDYPVIVGSSLKGALKDFVIQNGKGREDLFFGKPDEAGTVIITDARLLLLPVRSLNGHFKWTTCLYLLERLQRDMQLIGINKEVYIPPDIPEEKALVKNVISETLYLEELSFTASGWESDFEEKTIEVIKTLIQHESVQNRLSDQLVVLNDADFNYFAKHGLQINARNQLEENTKISKNLWYEETIPPDSLFYALIMTRPGQEEMLLELKGLFEKRPYLQIGGNETVGQGWCAVSFTGEGER